MYTQALGHFTGRQASSPPFAGSCFPLLCWRCKPLLCSSCFAAGSGDKHWQPGLHPLPLEEFRQCCSPPVSAATKMPKNTPPGHHHLLQAGQGLLTDNVVSLGHLRCVMCLWGWELRHPPTSELWKVLIPWSRIFHRGMLFSAGTGQGC